MKNKIKQRILLLSAAVVFIAVVALLVISGMDFKDTPKVGFIMTGSSQDSGWNGMHYAGVNAACESLGTELILKENVYENSGMCAEAIHELVSEGAGMIILSSYSYPMEVKEVIEMYPQISFYAISSEYISDNLTSYFGRMYQARYLAGIVAGLTTESDSVGYVAAMQNNEVNRGINAFTLGVKRVNPKADVHVYFTGSWDDHDVEVSAVNTLVGELSVDVVTYHQNQHYVAQTADELGVYSIGYNQVAEGLSDKYLTAAVWNWESLYHEIIREYVQGRPNSVNRHWFDIESGAVCLSELSPIVSDDVKRELEIATSELASGMNVFSGVIFDNEGVQHCDDGESISDDSLLNKMDWFVDGVMIYES